MFSNWTSWFSGLAGSHWIQATEVLPHNCLVAVRFETLNAAGHLIKRWDGLESFLNSDLFPLLAKLSSFTILKASERNRHSNAQNLKNPPCFLGIGQNLVKHTIGWTDPKILPWRHEIPPALVSSHEAKLQMQGTVAFVISPMAQDHESGLTTGFHLLSSASVGPGSQTMCIDQRDKCRGRERQQPSRPSKLPNISVFEEMCKCKCTLSFKKHVSGEP